MTRSKPEAIPTRQRLLDAAQTHFVEHGLQHASVRAITALASANPASVVYYFGSKEELFEAVLNRCVESLVRPRLAALDALPADAASSRSEQLERLLRILAEPYVLNRADSHRPAAVYARFYGRMYAEPNDIHRRVVKTGFEDLQQRYFSELSRLLPDLAPGELSWRLVAIMSALVHVAADTGVAQRIAPQAAATDDQTLLDSLVKAFVGMLQAPGAAPAK
jgi:AcrR family transcriptional regulator